MARATMHLCLVLHICRARISHKIIPAWIINYTHYNVRYDITYPFPDFNSEYVEIWEIVDIFASHFQVM